MSDERVSLSYKKLSGYKVPVLGSMINLSPHVRPFLEWFDWDVKSKFKAWVFDILYIMIILYFVDIAFIFPKSTSSIEKKALEPTSLTEVLCRGIDWWRETIFYCLPSLASPEKYSWIFWMGLAKSNTSMFTLKEYSFLTRGL